jgi:hypothetical protein
MATNPTLKTNAYISETWDGGYKLEIDLTAQAQVDNWKFNFNLPYTIREVYGAKLTKLGNGNYSFSGQDYNQNLDAKESTKAIFIIDDRSNQPLVPQFQGISNNLTGVNNNPITDDNDDIDLGFRVHKQWKQGFTGQLDITNNGDQVKGWTAEFDAPFNIEKIFGAEIVSHEGNHYVIANPEASPKLYAGKTRTISFVANKVNGSIVEPSNLSFTDTPEGVTPPQPQPEPQPQPQPQPLPQPKPGSGQFNYGEALQKSFLFFEANRSGVLPKDNRIEWRGNSATNDGSDVGRDLTGGYYDAGDHVKFGLPMAANNTMLAWGGVEYEQAYKQAGQWDELLEAVKWGTDYFLKAHVAENGKTKELYVQVGDGDADHKYWGSPEKMTMARPAFKIDASKPGSDVAAQTASALASASMLFRSTDAAYADKLLKNAEQLFEFADTYRGKYSDSVPAANPFYTSFSGYSDELAEGAAWLYKATGEQKYLDRAEEIYDNEIGYPSDWTWMADNKSNSGAVLLAQESNNPKYQQMVEGWLENWINGTGSVQYTPGGLAWRTQWGSLALSSSTSFLAQLYNDTVKQDSRYTDFASNQIDYILGDNPRNASYMIGFGENYPQQPHHRAATGDAPYGQPAEHILFGSLVGGPGSLDDFNYNDDRNDWITNEVGTGYNAPLTSALIQQYDNFGGDPLTDAQLDALPGIVVTEV